MPVYTVHEPPPPKGRSDADPTRIVFVRDGFSFWAFLLGPVWLIWHGLWLALVGYLGVTAGLHLGLAAAGASGGTRAAVALLVAVLVGLEAQSLRRWTLTRRGWRNVGVVVADDQDVAERRFFDAWTGQLSSAAAAPPPVPPPPPPPRAGAGAGEVIGVFPRPGTWP
jgi:hypothetical protein